MADILSDKFGARRMMYWTFLVSVVCTFILSYPPTQYIMQGTNGPDHLLDASERRWVSWSWPPCWASS